MDHFSQIGNLALGSRLKRMSDYIMTEGKEIYKSKGVDFEPKWFPLFSLLNDKEKVTITEAAKALGFTHPFISQLAKEMEKKGLVKAVANQMDGRSRYIQLTTKGESVAHELLPIWKDIRKSFEDVFNNMESSFMDALTDLENAFKVRSFSERVEDQKQTTKPKPAVQILSYRPKYRADFERLNREWLEKDFKVEPVDEEYFKDPEALILDNDGEILFAEYNGEIVGTIALVKENGRFELAKMAVTEKAKGLGIGRKLGLALIERARERGLKNLMLMTNSKLKPAINLYHSLGFITTYEGPNPKYERSDTEMTLEL